MRGKTPGHRILAVVGALFIIAIVSLDHWLGFGFNLFPLYLLPLAVVAWNESLSYTLAMSVLAGTGIMLKLFLTKQSYAHTFFWYWDGTVKFTILVIFSLGLWRIRQLQLLQQKQNVAKISELNISLKSQVDRLTAANNELAEVSYTISHDLRAPLRHIIGFAELLRQRNTSLDEKSRHYLDVISRSTQKMGNLIDGLLAFSQLGRTELMKTPVNLDLMVRQVVHELGKKTTGREIQWQIEQLPGVVADAAMLRLVLFNLIPNAIKFTRPRSPARIEIGFLDADKETFFYVKDNGVGFDMRYVSKLFNIFQRLHKPEEFEGTGVGLANVQRVIVRHGGRVWAEGALGEGATIWFSLPKLAPSEPHPPVPPLSR